MALKVFYFISYLSKDLNIWQCTFLMKFFIIFIITVTLSTHWLTFLWKTFNLVLGMEYIWSSSEGVWCDGSQGFHCFQSAPWFNSVLVWSSAWSGDPYSYTSPLAPVPTLLLMAGKKLRTSCTIPSLISQAFNKKIGLEKWEFSQGTIEW